MSPDGARFIVGMRGGIFKLWNTKDVSEVWTITGFPGRMHDARFSPDGRQIAVCGSDFLRLLDAATGGTLVASAGNVGGTSALAFSPDGRRLASGGQDNVVRIWDVASGQELLALQGHASRVDALTFSADGLKLVSGDYLGSIRLWDAGAAPAVAPAAK